MRYLGWFLLFLAACSPLRAETTLNTETVKKMVVFLYAAHEDGTVDSNRPMGTGFLISVGQKGAPVTSREGITVVKGVMFLITARHIVDPNWAFCSQRQPGLIWMRLNKKEYDPKKDSTGVEYVPLPLVADGHRQYFLLDDDDTVDAAVIDVSRLLGQADGEKQKYDTLTMSLSAFASPDEIKALRIGDSIASAGLIPGKSGEKRNYPFFKFGNISNRPDELTPIGCGDGLELRLEKAWFIATNLIGGNSGSPIFYYPPEYCRPASGVFCTRGLNRPIIIGVQSSSVTALSDQGRNNVLEPADIAAMTPIEDVFKIIERLLGSSDLDLYRGDESKRK